MNTLRQLFSVRTLVALRQNTLVTPVPVDTTPPSRFNTTATASTTTNVPVLPKELLSTSLVKHTQWGQIANESFVKQYQQLDNKLEIVYRCKVCNTRNVKTISEAAYHKGVVILQCDGCSTTHLIVDNLGWFTNSKGKSVNQVLAEKGELIRKIVINEKGEILKS